MDIKKLVQEIYDFQGTAIEYLEYEANIRKQIENLSEEENEYLMDSEAMEPLTMICEGIRFEVERFQNATPMEKKEMLNSETGEQLKQVLEYMGIEYKA